MLYVSLRRHGEDESSTSSLSPPYIHTPASARRLPSGSVCQETPPPGDARDDDDVRFPEFYKQPYLIEFETSEPGQETDPYERTKASPSYNFPLDFQRYQLPLAALHPASFFFSHSFV
jgi:hypothetical protein